MTISTHERAAGSDGDVSDDTVVHDVPEDVQEYVGELEERVLELEKQLSIRDVSALLCFVLPGCDAPIRCLTLLLAGAAGFFASSAAAPNLMRSCRRAGPDVCRPR